VRNYAMGYSWDAATRQFLQHLQHLHLAGQPQAAAASQAA